MHRKTDPAQGDITRQLWYYKDYPVCKRIRDVPAWVWVRDDLVVERFVPEKEGDEYALRVWLSSETRISMFGCSARTP
jgi:hypothetical protein